MSKYTTEVRYICEVAAGLKESEGYSSIDTIINKAIPKIFDFSFPIYDENYRKVLQRKILKHYYTREIGPETVALWKLFLDRRLNEIMPYYNKLYETETLKFNPFYDIDLTTEHKGTGSETKTEKSNQTNSNSQTTHSNGTRSLTGDEELTKETQLSENGSSAETGTIEDEGGKTATKTLNTTTTATDSGTDSKSGSDVKKNNRWDIYSDTPQGSLQNITTSNGAYLTNARNIIDDGTGSTFSETINHGKVTTTRETGTVSDTETNGNTRTLDTSTTTEGTKEGSENTTGHNETAETTADTTTLTGSASSNNTGSHNINTTNDYIEHVSGKSGSGSYTKMLMEYRDSILNIDMMVINELSDLFFNLW